MKNNIKTTARRCIIAALLFLLWGIGGMYAQIITITPVGTDYTTKTLQFTVSWNPAEVPAGKVWVWVDFCPMTGIIAGSYGPAAIQSASGNVASVSTRGFFVTMPGATITATLNTTQKQFNWCAYGSAAPPRAELRADGSYILKGTPPFTINGTITETTHAFAAGTCISALTDLTGHPEGYSTPPPAAPTSPSSHTYCGAGNMVFSAVAPEDCTIDWWDAATGGTKVSTDAADYTISSTGTGTYTYYAEARYENSVCVSGTRLPVTATVNALPAITSFTASPATVCPGAAVTLTASATGAASYSFAGGAWTTSASATKTVNAASTYTVKARSSAGCESAEASVPVALLAAPAAPTGASKNARCGTGTVTFSATAPSGCAIDWYNASANGSIVTGGAGVASFSPSLSATTTYYAQARSTATGCVSTSRLAVTGTVVPNPSTPSLTKTSGVVCAGSRITFTASGGSGSYVWSGAVSSTSGSSVMSNNTTAGNYTATVYSTVTSGGITCKSSSTSTTGAITAPGTNGQSAICGCSSGLQNCNGTCTNLGCSNCMCWSACNSTQGYYNSTGDRIDYYSRYGITAGIQTGFTQISNNTQEGSGGMNWRDASIYCGNKGSGWRLPTLNELKCACDRRNNAPALSFANNSLYWTATPRSGVTDTYYTVAFDGNKCTVSEFSRIGESYYVKCVH
jgi:hypothetical protein